MKKILLVALLLGGCGGNNQPANYQPPLSGWTQLFGSGAKGINFSFPAAPGSVQYVVEPPPKVALGQTVTLKFVLTGDGTFGVKDTTDKLPAKVTLLLWRKGDNLTGQGVYETYREYCTCRTIITAPGTFSVSAVVDPANWTGVFGKTPSAADFQALLNNLYAVGFTFGGSSFAGHGLYANGSISFLLADYTIQ